MSFFKRLFSRSNLILKIDDGGRAAAGIKGIQVIVLLGQLQLLQNFHINKFIATYLKLTKNLEQTLKLNLQEV